MAQTENLLGAKLGPLRPMDSMERGMFNNTTWPPSCEVTPAMSVIHNFVYFEPRAPSLHALRQLCVDRLMLFSRFSAVAKPNGTWEPVERPLDFGYHLIEEEVDSIAERQQTLLKEPLDLSKPLWRVVVLREKGGRQCVDFQIHHTTADGFRLAMVCEELALAADGSRLSFAKETKKRYEEYLKTVTWWKRILMAFASVIAFFKVAMYSVKPMETEMAVTTPREHRRTMKVSGERRYVEFNSMPLHKVKQIGKAIKGTVNDVLIAVTGGACRRYCEAKNDPHFTQNQKAAKARVRALVPVGMPERSSWQAHDCMGNRFMFASIDMPIQPSAPKGRLELAKKTMDGFKRTMEASVGMFFVETLVGLLPLALRQKAALDLFARHQFVFSNVPGPPSEITVCGERVTGVQTAFSNLIHQIIILSYNGTLFMNGVFDTAFMDTDLFVRCFSEELQELEEQVLPPADTRT